jgi:hypothetical protein
LGGEFDDFWATSGSRSGPRIDKGQQDLPLDGEEFCPLVANRIAHWRLRREAGMAVGHGLGGRCRAFSGPEPGSGPTVGDFVVTQAGYAIAILSRARAVETLEMLGIDPG